MRIDIKDLPLNLQKQALRKLAEEEKRTGNALSGISNVLYSNEKPSNGEEGRSAEVRGSKYGAKKVTLTLNDGTEHTFDSKHEAEIYQELALLERSGEISDLRIQVPFKLIDKQVAPRGKKYRECKYIADFVYMKNDTKETVVADAKGYRTPEYRLKKKLMLDKWGIEIKEV